MVSKRTLGESVFNVVNIIFLALISFVCIYPLYFVIIGSISSGPTMRFAYFWPVNFTLVTYEKLLTSPDIYRAFFISLSRTVLGTCLSIYFTSMLAYLLTKQKMKFRKFVYRFFLVTMYFNAGLIPWYITMRTYGLQNNYLLYIIPGIIGVFNVILVKTYIESIPSSIEESAEIDGAGFLTTFMQIILPLTKPILATITVFTAVGHWNSWVDNFFLVSDRSIQTLQLMLYNYINQAQALATAMRNATASTASSAMSFPISPENIRMAMVVITVIPVVMVYPFLQKYFTKGIMIGAVKG